MNEATIPMYCPNRVNITNTKVHTISRLRDYLPSSSIGRYPNSFRRTRWADQCDAKDIHTPGYNQIITDDHGRRSHTPSCCI
jgi:hypothetical protein